MSVADIDDCAYVFEMSQTENDKVFCWLFFVCRLIYKALRQPSKMGWEILISILFFAYYTNMNLIALPISMRPNYHDMLHKWVGLI